MASKKKQTAIHTFKGEDPSQDIVVTHTYGDCEDACETPTDYRAMPVIPAEIIAGVQEAQKETGCWASLTIAQWAQETGWGKHIIPGSNNLFNVKQFGDGPFVEVPTKEFEHGQWVVIQAKFVKYATVSDSILAHGQLLMNPNGPYAQCLPWHGDVLKWTQRVAHIYATDPLYSQHLTDIICQNNLTRFDQLPAQCTQPVESVAVADTSLCGAPPEGQPEPEC